MIDKELLKEYIIENVLPIEGKDYSIFLNSYSQSIISTINVDNDIMTISMLTPPSRKFDNNRTIYCSKIDFDYWCKECKKDKRKNKLKYIEAIF